MALAVTVEIDSGLTEVVSQSVRSTEALQFKMFVCVCVCFCIGFVLISAYNYIAAQLWSCES